MPHHILTNNNKKININYYLFMISFEGCFFLWDYWDLQNTVIFYLFFTTEKSVIYDRDAC